MRKVLLVILDGWGHSDFAGEPDAGNAVELANVPTFRRLYDGRPRNRLACSGADVGLPAGQMGNSEVGHLNLGAGRVVYQDIARIDQAIEDGALTKRLDLERLVAHVRATGAAMHVVGLVSDGGVHSHLRHFTALLDLLPADVRVRLHCITDGRDTSPTGGLGYLRTLDERCAGNDRWSIASVCGRYWAMDRDRRWDRTKRAFDLIVRGEAPAWADDYTVLSDCYAAGTTDEFVEPTGIRGVAEPGLGRDDVVILMNFRADRMRQLTAALSLPDFDGFERGGALPAKIVTMTEYQEGLPVSAAFPPDHVRSGLSEFLATRGCRQLKVAETEKYAHVTYFFNGGEETAWEGETRSLVPSPRVATYDLQPEMSARPVADAVVDGVLGGHDFILVNFANPDMVGHTGSIPAAVKAVEAVDGCMADILRTIDDFPEWVALVTADHGNCEKMIDAEGNVHTAHTTEPVDFIIYDPLQVDDTGASDPARRCGLALWRTGRLADVAPTVLGFMGIDPPPEMTGENLVLPPEAEEIGEDDEAQEPGEDHQGATVG
jgi:2,3-bisphosphoglycerate-independent phosphoglycerate mutase